MLVGLNKSVSTPGDVKSRCEASRSCVDAGDYEAACEALGSYWRGVGLRPDVRGLPIEDAAGVFLQAGVLTSAIGEQQKSETAPLLARALIGEGKVLFETINSARVIEADSEIGGAYIRSKNYDTAAAKLALVLRQIGDEPSELRSATVCRLATALIGISDIEGAISLLNESSLSFELAASAHQRGKYHHLIATAYTLKGEQSGEVADFDRALLEYEAACFFLEASGNKTYLAISTNNRGELFLRLRMLHDAEVHLMRARRLFVELNRTAYVEEVDRSLAMIRPPSPPHGNLPPNVIPFRPSQVEIQTHILTVPDVGLIDRGFVPGDRLELRITDQFNDGDVVLIEAEGVELLARGYHWSQDGIRVTWAYDLFPAREYEKGEYKLKAVL